jgi:hypothetical protein
VSPSATGLRPADLRQQLHLRHLRLLRQLRQAQARRRQADHLLPHEEGLGGGGRTSRSPAARCWAGWAPRAAPPGRTCTSASTPTAAPTTARTRRPPVRRRPQYWVSQGAYLGLPRPPASAPRAALGRLRFRRLWGSCGTCAAGRPATARAVRVRARLRRKQCGSDGCGGSCGTCAAGTACDRAGRCVCAPACAGKQCGSDGCGGSCGSCAAGTACDGAGRCACAPDCAGRACGSDGCGGSCGSCAPGLACDEGTGQCVCAPDCAGKACGPDGCGGSCGECAAGQKCDEEGRCEGAVASPDAGASGDGGPARSPAGDRAAGVLRWPGRGGDAASWAAACSCSAPSPGEGAALTKGQARMPAAPNSGEHMRSGGGTIAARSRSRADITGPGAPGALTSPTRSAWSSTWSASSGELVVRRLGDRRLHRAAGGLGALAAARGRRRARSWSTPSRSPPASREPPSRACARGGPACAPGCPRRLRAIQAPAGAFEAEHAEPSTTAPAQEAIERLQLEEARVGSGPSSRCGVERGG